MKTTKISTGFLPVVVLCTVLGSPVAALAQAIIPPPAPTSQSGSGSNPSRREVEESDRTYGKDFYFIAQHWTAWDASKANVALRTGIGDEVRTGNVTFELEEDWVWGFGAGYSFNEQLNLNFDFTFGEPDYKSTFGGLQITGESWTHTGEVSLDFNLLKRPFTPYVSVGIGYFYIDTGIPSGPPEYWVWWDYWWGYTATVTQPTFSETFFTASAEAGVRWDVNDSFFLKAGVSSYWMDTHVGWIDNMHTSISIGWRY